MKKLSDFQADKLSKKEMKGVTGGASPCTSDADCLGVTCYNGYCGGSGEGSGKCSIHCYNSGHTAWIDKCPDTTAQAQQICTQLGGYGDITCVC